MNTGSVHITPDPQLKAERVLTQRDSRVKPTGRDRPEESDGCKREEAVGRRGGNITHPPHTHTDALDTQVDSPQAHTDVAVGKLRDEGYSKQQKKVISHVMLQCP